MSNKTIPSIVSVEAFFSPKQAGTPTYNSYTGDIVNFNAIAQDLISAKATISPVQSLNGYEYPWAGGAGKNLLPDTYYNGDTYTNGNVTFKKNADGSVTVSCSTADTLARNYALIQQNTASPFKAGVLYTVTCIGATGYYGNKVWMVFGGSSSSLAYATPYENNAKTFTLSSDNETVGYCLIQAQAGFTGTVTVKPIICLSSDYDGTWSPYKNLCPISGWQNVNIYREATYDPTASPTLTFSFGQTVYGGELDAVGGSASVNMGYVADLSSLYWMESSSFNGIFFTAISGMKHKTAAGAEEALCSAYAGSSALYLASLEDFHFITGATSRLYIKNSNCAGDVNAFKATVSGAQFVYPLNTPTTITLSPQTMQTLLGENNLWADCGEITAAYFHVCPISGWTGADFFRTSKNLLDTDAFETYSNWSSALAPYGNYNTTSQSRGFKLNTKSGQTYTASFGIDSTTFPNNYLYLCRANGTATELVGYFTTTTFQSSKLSFTAEAGWFYFFRWGSLGSESNFNTQLAKISYEQLELGSTASDFVPYDGKKATVDFGQTYYEGTIDCISGAGKKTWESLSLVGSTEATYAANGATANTSRALVTISGKANGATNILSDKFTNTGEDVVGNIVGRSGDNKVEFFLPPDVPQTVDGIKAWFASNNTQVVYELATPVDFSVTGQDL